MRWSFKEKNKVVHWKLGAQMGSFLVDIDVDFDLLAYDDQVKIAEEKTGIEAPQMVLTYSEDR